LFLTRCHHGIGTELPGFVTVHERNELPGCIRILRALRDVPGVTTRVADDITIGAGSVGTYRVDTEVEVGSNRGDWPTEHPLLVEGHGNLAAGKLLIALPG